MAQTIQDLKEAVCDLYTFRDEYFEHHTIDSAKNKDEDIASQLDKTLHILDESRAACEAEDKAQFCLLRGKALNIKPEFNEEALEILSKAVKLNPKLVDAWNELGECYWKKGDIAASKNCFEGALKQSKNAASLRNLSMILRQIGQDPKEKMANVQESVEKAREAVNLDIQDGKSWYILGNAHLSLFFSTNQSPAMLKQCMSAYNQALQDKAMVCNPDLHFNRAVALKYEEKYQEALESFEKASRYDPLWNEPKEELQHLIEFLEKMQDMVTNKGHQKSRKIRLLLKALKQQHLGPYANNSSYTSEAGKAVSLKLVKLSELQPGHNVENVILGKVVCNVSSHDPVAFSFCLIDENETCMAVSIYNLAQGKGVIIGDSVAIAEPFVQHVDVHYKDKVIAFSSIRVNSPTLLVVNGKKISFNQQAPPRLSVTVKSE